METKLVNESGPAELSGFSGPSRREFLRTALVAPSLLGLLACSDREPVGPEVCSPGTGYGPLVTSPDCPELQIPAGFRCIRLSETGKVSAVNPALIVPPALDGMGTFRLSGGRTLLVRNHEVRDAAGGPPLAPTAYDGQARGGTTSLEVRVTGSGQSLKVELLGETVSLAGTLVNCAGGLTPWGTWLSCEETTAGQASGYNRAHGYVFEVPATPGAVADPRPLLGLGRFVHEAVAVDPNSSIVYMTEDREYKGSLAFPGSGFYRFIPARRGELRGTGLLQALAVLDISRANTTTGQLRGASYEVEWITINDPNPGTAEIDPSAVFRQALDGGAAIFQRLEGCWYADRAIYFNATTGGDAGAGQIWQYRPGDPGGTLNLVFESPGSSVLNQPDNLCASPGGGLILCEDPASSGDRFIRELTCGGEIFDLVRQPDRADATEFAGACFDPDRKVLFFNLQGGSTFGSSEPGATYALWGPWALS